MRIPGMAFWITILASVWLGISSANAANFDTNYVARAGDLNGDGVVDSMRHVDGTVLHSVHRHPAERGIRRR